MKNGVQIDKVESGIAFREKGQGFMFCKVYSALCLGIEGCIVRVEADMSNGLPAFQIVGELSSEVRESGAQDLYRHAEFRFFTASQALSD